jgi:hypothetical protein
MHPVSATSRKETRRLFPDPTLNRSIRPQIDHVRFNLHVVTRFKFQGSQTHIDQAKPRSMCRKNLMLSNLSYEPFGIYGGLGRSAGDLDQVDSRRDACDILHLGRDGRTRCQGCQCRFESGRKHIWSKLDAFLGVSKILENPVRYSNQKKIMTGRRVSGPRSLDLNTKGSRFDGYNPQPSGGF